MHWSRRKKRHYFNFSVFISHLYPLYQKRKRKEKGGKAARRDLGVESKVGGWHRRENRNEVTGNGGGGRNGHRVLAAVHVSMARLRGQQAGHLGHLSIRDC